MEPPPPQQRQRQQQPLGNFLGSSETKDLGKILLEHLDSAGEHMECYRAYLGSTVSFNVSHRSVSMLTPRLLSQFYVADNPLVHPKYFDLFEGQNLSKLENAIQKRLVVLMQGADGQSWDKIHDKRVYDGLKSPAAAAAAAAETFYFVLKYNAPFWELYELVRRRHINSYVQLLSEDSFVEAGGIVQSPDNATCLFEVLTAVLNVRRSRRQQQQLHQHHSPACQSLRELVFAKDKNAVAREVGAEFILTSHLRSKPLVKDRLRRLPQNNMFGIHSVFSYAESRDCMLQSLPVVCVTENLRFYCLASQYAATVREVQSRRRHPKQEPFPGHARNLKQKRAAAAPAAAAAAAEDPDVIRQVDSCPCSGCKQAKNYEHNMSACGPQVPFKTDLSTFDLFKLLGKWSDKTEADLLNACRLSIASFDVESVATAVPDNIGSEDLNFNPPTLSGHRVPRQVQSVHIPCRIGYTDQLRCSTERPTLIFRLDPDNPDQMVAAFVEAIFEAREEATTVKYGILHPYFEVIEKYKRAHFEFFQNRGWLPSDYCHRWQSFQPSDLLYDDNNTDANTFYNEEDDEEETEAELDRLGAEAVAELAEELEGWDDEDEDGDERMHQRPGRRAGSPNMEDFDDDASNASVDSQIAAAAVRKAKAKRDMKRISDIEDAWKHSIFGLLEKRLRTLAHQFTVYGFNRCVY